MHTDSHKAGLVGAVMIGGWHVLWSSLIFLGWAQPLFNFSMWAHMVHTNIILGPFDAQAAVTVVIIASCIGYGIGYILASVWNRVHSN